MLHSVLTPRPMMSKTRLPSNALPLAPALMARLLKQMALYVPHVLESTLYLPDPYRNVLTGLSSNSAWAVANVTVLSLLPLNKCHLSPNVWRLVPWLHLVLQSITTSELACATTGSISVSRQCRLRVGHLLIRLGVRERVRRMVAAVGVLRVHRGQSFEEGYSFCRHNVNLGYHDIRLDYCANGEWFLFPLSLRPLPLYYKQI